MVLTTNAGYPLDRNLYQAVKGMAAAERVVADRRDHRGGRRLRRRPARRRPLRPAAGRGRPGPADLDSDGGAAEADRWQVQVLGRVLRRAAVWLHTDGLSDDEVRAAHLDPVGDVSEAVARALAAPAPGPGSASCPRVRSPWPPLCRVDDHRLSLTPTSEIECRRCPRGSLFEFTVPDELLREAVTRLPDPEAVAEIGVIPGTGEGKPPPLLGILRESGYAPLVLLTVAAIVPSTFGAGINLIGNNLENSFHLSDAGLGAVAFVASVSQFLWAVPLALWADRGSRKTVAAVALLDLLRLRDPDGAVPQHLVVRLPLPAGLAGGERQPDRAQLLPGRRLPHRGPEPGLQLALPGRPHRPDGGHPDLRDHRQPHPRLALGPGASPAPASPSPWPCSACTSRTRGPTSRATS